jgi:hypothetical protein
MLKYNITGRNLVTSTYLLHDSGKPSPIKSWWTSMTTAAAGEKDTNPRGESPIHSFIHSFSQSVRSISQVTDLTIGTHEI